MTEAPVTDLDLAEVEGLLEAATPGPWRWQVHLHGKQIELAGSGHSVMRFARWGMNGARPRLLSGGIMHDAEEFAAIVPGREHHARWFQTIDHPDANLIAAAPSIIRSLLSALKAERERAAQAWRPIETAPKDGTTILLYLADEGFSTLGRWRLDADDPSDDGAFWLPAMDEWADTTGETALHHATHWQPLPSPPGDVGGSDATRDESRAATECGHEYVRHDGETWRCMLCRRPLDPPPRRKGKGRKP